MSDEQEKKAEDSLGITNTKDGVWRMDVDTFAPKPEGHIVVAGVEYPIYSFLDVKIKDSLKVASLGDDINSAEDYDARLERSVEQIMLLNAPGEPRLTREVFEALSPRQIINLTVLASSIAKVPLKAAGEQESASGDSPSPSPESATSTGGGERSSST